MSRSCSMSRLPQQCLCLNQDAYDLGSSMFLKSGGRCEDACPCHRSRDAAFQLQLKAHASFCGHEYHGSRVSSMMLELLARIEAGFRSLREEPPDILWLRRFALRLVGAQCQVNHRRRRAWQSTCEFVAFCTGHCQPQIPGCKPKVPSQTH